ncbi:hypothetical protein [Streptomyces capoamus]|uniref:hypothetical protein n=1 Tax=Streptomyces capoamus TaxID=68183 RepID=UPI00167705D0|nr:hypothetical protein [Streptomyces capoamus]
MRIRRTPKVVVAVVGQAAMVALQVLLQEDAAVTGSWMTRLIPLAPMLLGMYMVWRLFLNPYVSFGQDRLRVNNIFTHYLVPYHLITALEGRSALTLVVSGYGRLPVAALDAAPLTGKAKRDAVAQELLRRRAAGAPRAGHGFEKRSTLGLPEWLGPIACLACFLVGGFASALAH